MNTLPLCKRRFLGHKWSIWRKGLGLKQTFTMPNNQDCIAQQVRLRRRCLCCGYIHEIWLESWKVLHVLPKKETVPTSQSDN